MPFTMTTHVDCNIETGYIYMEMRERDDRISLLCSTALDTLVIAWWQSREFMHFVNIAQKTRTVDKGAD